MDLDPARLAETAALFGSLLLTLMGLFVPIAAGVALAQRWLGPKRLQRWLGGRRLGSALVRGIALGAVTPFCGCSTVPLLSALLQARVRFAAVVAFLTASPLLNPYILAVVALLFGPRAAAAYAVFGVAVAATVAVVWERLGLERWLRAHVRPPVPIADGAVPNPVGATATETGPARTRGATDAGGCNADRAASPLHPAGESDWRGWRAEAPAAAREGMAMLRPMIGPLLVGVSVGALIYGAVPHGMVHDAVVAAGPAAVPLAAALGIPLYLRGEAAFPIGAGLLATGVPTGPMLAMVVGGMAASVPELALLRGLFTWRLLAAFVATVLATAIAAGLVLPPVW